MLASQSEIHHLRYRYNPKQTDYNTLIAALNAGWAVELPVLQQSVWNLTAQQSMAFHFVLTRSAGQVALLLNLPDGEAVRRLITDYHWTVKDRRP